MPAKTKVIFLCTGNSARSQLGEALLRHYAGHVFDVYSAGLEPKGINPFTTRALAEIGLSTANQSSKSIKEYLGKMNFGYIITVCSDADERCPTTFLSQGAQRLRWPFPDPAAATGSDEEKLAAFRATREAIAARIRTWLAEKNIAPKPTVMFLCTGNSARSQMGEALLRHLAGDRFEVFSADTHPKGVNPFTIRALRAIGIDASNHTSKTAAEVVSQHAIDYLITVCGEADENCPPGLFPVRVARLHWPFDDPAAATGSDDDKLAVFARVRDEIQARLQAWLAEPTTP